MGGGGGGGGFGGGGVTPKSIHFPFKMYFNICLILFVKEENNVFIHNFTFLY